MKKIKGLIGILFFSFIFLVGCKDKDLSDKEAVRYLENLLVHSKVEVISADKEKGAYRFRLEDGYDLDFRLKRRLYNVDPIPVLHHAYITDFDQVLTDYLLEQYQGDKEFIQTRTMYVKDLTSTYYLYIEYEDLQSLRQGLKQLENFISYSKDLNPDLSYDLYAIYREKESIFRGDLYSHRTIKRGSDLDSLEEFKNQAVSDYLAFAVENNFYEELNPAISLEEFVRTREFGRFTFRNKEGDTLVFDDLLSFDTYFRPGLLYQFLERIGYPSLEGDMGDFEFTGENGKRYEFSQSSFREEAGLRETFEEDIIGKRKFIYKVDGREEEDISINALLFQNMTHFKYSLEIDNQEIQDLDQEEESDL